MPQWEKYERGIMDKALDYRRCDRCDSLLEHSNYKNVKLIYSTNQKKEVGFVCIRCALKTKTTIEELDNYLADKLRLNHLFKVSE